MPDLIWREELLNLKVGDGTDQVQLKDYKPTDGELFSIEEKLLEEMRLALSYNDIRVEIDYNRLFEIVDECLADPRTKHEFNYIGHDWELLHGRVQTIVQWLNPKRNSHIDGEGRYYSSSLSAKEGYKGCQGCRKRIVPMTYEQAMEWAKDIDDSFFDAFNIPHPM